MQTAMRLWPQGRRQEKGTNRPAMESNIQWAFNSNTQLLSPTCPAGGWETAVLALHSVLPPCPAEDQGAEEGLWLLQFLVPERERPPLQTAPPSPPPPTQAQQFSPQVCSMLCHLSRSRFQPPGCSARLLIFSTKWWEDFCVCCLRLFAKSTHLLQTEWELESWAGAGTVEAEVKFLFLFDPHEVPEKTPGVFKCRLYIAVWFVFVCFFSCCSHKSSSIQKETPKKKPKLEMKPSNGDRCDRRSNSSKTICTLRKLIAIKKIVISF